MSRGDRILALLVIVMAATVLVFADQFADVVATVTRWTVHHGAVAFIWLASALLVVAVGLALSPWGGRRLGVDETARPEFGFPCPAPAVGASRIASWEWTAILIWPSQPVLPAA